MKLKYFLNAVHYCMGTWRALNLQWAINVILSTFPLIFPGVPYNVPDKQDIRHVSRPSNFIGFVTSAYCAPIGLVLAGIADANSTMRIVIIALCVGFGFMPVNNAIYTGHKYLKYCRLFEKKDKAWFIKWWIITILFVAGTVAAFWTAAMIYIKLMQFRGHLE